MSFSADLIKFANKTNSTLDESVKAIKLALFSSVIMDTRVDTGRLRGNWQTTTGQPASGEIDRIDPTGANAIDDASKNVGGSTIDYLTNNLPYAEVYEEKDAMIEKNMVRIERIIKENVSKN